MTGFQLCYFYASRSSLNHIISVQIRYIVVGVTIQPLFETSLIQEVANESHGSPENKQSVETSVSDMLVSLLIAKGATSA